MNISNFYPHKPQLLKLAALVIIVIEVFLLTGCSTAKNIKNFILGKNEPLSAAEAVLKKPFKETINYEDVELIWEIPREPVEGFIIHYGYIDSNKADSVKVLTTELSKFEDKQFGFVYQYILKNIRSDKTLKVAISSFDKDQVSPPSKTEIIEPTQDPGIHNTASNESSFPKASRN
jgi:hypothetical protein